MIGIKKRLKNIMAATAIALAGIMPQSHATTMFDGLKGPTEHQVEVRLTSVDDKINKENLTERLVLKGWHGQKEEGDTGYWWFVNVPYQQITTKGNDSNKGIGDVTIGAGPIGVWKGIDWFTYAAVTMPTGDTGYQRPEKDYSLEGFVKGLAAAPDRLSRLKLLCDYGSKVAKHESLPEDRPALGSGRTDVSLGLCLTKLWKEGKLGLNGSLDYTVTGTGSNGINPSDILSAGILGDIEPVKNLRIGTGVEYWTDLKNNDGASITGMVQKGFKDYRYVLELRVDQGIKNSDTTKITAAFKYNF